MLTEKKVSTSLGELHVWDSQVGEPVLFVHGFPLDHSMWIKQSDRFADQYRVIAPDLPGFGMNASYSGTLTMKQMADALVEMLDGLELTQPVTVCGLSMGGYVAWQLILHYPERIEDLILCDTRAAADSDDVRQGRLKLAAQVLASGAGLVADSMPAKLFAPVTIESNKPCVEITRQVIQACPPETIAAALLGMAERPDVTGELPEIAHRTLVVCGEHDVITPPAEMEQMARSLPKAEFHLIPDAGHMAPLENPLRVNQVLESFLKR
ncbi:MAG: alpha/beta fold hydrolase [Planctomycetales bacterium]|nr:alpha/beta fold hydrolase [Planctomycetales bacterium]